MPSPAPRARLPRPSRLPAATPRAALALLLLAFALAAPLQADEDLKAIEAVGPDDVPRHALELRALVAPEEVLEALPGELLAAAGDARQRALLYLAQANACRVIADWICQRRAGADARAEAAAIDDPTLMARSSILESRAVMALQDFVFAEELLTDAQAQLERAPSAQLSADVQLAYSSLSHSLGKHALSADYARRGLALLGVGEAPPLQARLQRNLARALAKLDDADGARAALGAGIEVARRVDDPKLIAELHLESARLAHQSGDLEGQRRHVGEVLALADRLRNSQLYGQAREALGMAAQQAGDRAEARRQFEAARASFRELGLERDELRASQALIGLSLDLGVSLPRLDPLLRRYVDLQGKVAQSDRSQAADDFETRLRYAKQQMEVARLEGEARLAAERAEAFAAQRTLGLVALLLAALVATVLAVSFALQRRSNRLLGRALREQQRSESQAGELLRLSPGLVLLHDLDGRLLRVNTAAAQALGVGGRGDAAGALADGIVGQDRERLAGYLAELRRSGAASVELRIAGADGERLLRLDGRVAGRSSDVVGHAVDITEDAREAEALREQALVDPLTGCPNRRFLARFAATQAPDGALAAINVDLDGFKQINDRLGHDQGDRVLREVAAFLRARLREGDHLLRVGGDEFLALLPRADAGVLDRITARLAADAASAPCAYSLGAALREAGETLDALLARADAAMYAGRRARRGADYVGRRKD